MMRGWIVCANAVACWVAGGCAVPTGTAIVHVRDAATHEPISGATVRIVALDPRHPLRISDLLRSSPRSVPDVKTGPDGAASVSLPTDRPLQVHVLAAPQPFEGVYFDAWDGGETGWIGPPSEPPAWEVMIGPR